MPVSIFNVLVGITTIILQVAVVGLVVLLITKKHPTSQLVISFLSKTAHRIIPAVFIGSAIGSFIYEYGYGYEPCLLCWYQRIAIFGIAIITSISNIKTNLTVQKQLYVFAGLGLAVALFHNFIDIFPSSGVDVCGANSVSCLIRYVYEFGYITIPMMSLTVLLFGLLLTVVAFKKKA